MSFANAGIPVTIVDTTQEALERGLANIKKNYAATVAKGRLDAGRHGQAHGPHPGLDPPRRRRERRHRHRGGVRAHGREAGDLPQARRHGEEGRDPRHQHLHARRRPDRGRYEARRGDVVGTHFFSPANVMRLLEVVRGKKTAKDVLATTMKLGKRLKKVPVVSGVCDGFIGNRMLEKYAQQACFLLDEGASPQQVDAALQKLGHGDGPVHHVRHGGQRHRLGDPQAPLPRAPGLRVLARRRSRVRARPLRPEDRQGVLQVRARQPQAARRIPKCEQIIEKYRSEIGVQPRRISDEEIVQRCMYALANEGARILEEGIALRASDIDMVYLTGYGFPPYRGGPMFYADSVGLGEGARGDPRIPEGLPGRAVEARAPARADWPRPASGSTNRRRDDRSCHRLHRAHAALQELAGRVQHDPRRHDGRPRGARARSSARRSTPTRSRT